MSVMRLLSGVAVATFGSMLCAAGTRADEAWIDFTTYLRTGPGVHYRAIDEALSDERVDVLACEHGWCRIAYGGGSGFVSQDALKTRMTRMTPHAGGPCFVNRIAGYHGTRGAEFCAADIAHE